MTQPPSQTPGPQPTAPRASDGADTTPRARRNWFNSRAFRLSLGVGLIALAGVLVLPRVAAYTAEDAIIQGRTATLNTPIEGTLRYLDMAPGTRVNAGATLATVANKRLDRSFLNELITERDSLERRIAALADQAAGLEKLKADLDGRAGDLKGAAARTLARETAMKRAQRAAVAADLKAARLDLARQRTLADKQLAPKAKLEAAEAAVDRLSAQAATIDAELELLAEESRQAAAGIFVADGRYGAPYAEIRADEIAITLLDIAARASEQRTRADQIDRQIAQETARLAKAGASEIRSPHDGVVWRTLAAPGADVVIGQEIAQVLDCRSTFLEVLVSESRFDATRIGETIHYRPVGDAAYRSATVTALRGATTVAGDRTLAAALTAREDSQFRVYASFDDTPEAVDGGAYCNVGRHVDVRFPKALDGALAAPLALIEDLFGGR